MELGVELTPELIFFHMSEEIGEIARQLVNKYLPMREYKESNLKEGLAQAVHDLLVLSEVFNVDLSEGLNRKVDEMAKRRLLGQEAETSRSIGTGLSTVSVLEYAKENAGDFDSPESIFGVGIWGRYMKMWFPS